MGGCDDREGCVRLGWWSVAFMGLHCVYCEEPGLLMPLEVELSGRSRPRRDFCPARGSLGSTEGPLGTAPPFPPPN